MASWKLCVALLLCVLIALVAQAEGNRGRNNRRRNRQNRQNSQTDVATTDSDDDGDSSAGAGGDNQATTGNTGRQGRRWRGGAGGGAGRRNRGGRRRGNQGAGNRRNNRRGRGGRGGRGGRNNNNNNNRNGRANRMDPALLVRGLSSSMGSFGWDTYKRLAISNTDNFVFSPFSVYAAMGMLLLGAQADTKRQIVSALHVNSPVHRAFNHYNSSLPRGENSAGPVFSIANKLYHRQGFSYLPRYQRKVEDFYQSDIEEFQAESPEVAINEWVEDQTMGQIVDFLSEDSVTDETILMLVNAIYFQGNWSSPFESTDTFLRPFMVSDSSTVNVETMSRVGYYKKMHHESLLATVLELPYTGDRFSMFIVLPDEGVTLNSVESVLTAATLNSTLNADVSLSHIALEIPKFSLDTDEDMVERMRELGIQAVFDPSRCRLRRMTSAQNVVVSEIKHRAVIEVDEAGTTASAATSIGIILTSAQFAPQEFKVNRPFLFVLRDKTSHMNFFMGRYVNPQGDNVVD